LKFMPDAYVFPGGAVSSADGVEEWRDFYTKKEMSSLSPPKLTKHSNRPPLYRTPKDEPISRDLSLRITAIRETFEESGILLLEKNGQLIKSSDLPNKNEIKQWRNAVEADASKFLDICKELGACPKVDQFYEWSNWLTPPGILPKRFDTAFYLTNIPEIPDYAAEDGGETVHFAVMNPFEALSKSLKSEIILHPPQFTELSRIAKAYSLEVLIDYASNRQQRGIKRWCPNQIFFKGCRISAMVGDDLHQDIIEDCKVSKEFEDQDHEEYLKTCENYMRTVWTYKINEKGERVYSSMFTRTNLLYFDSETLMTTPIDHQSLQNILKECER